MSIHSWIDIPQDSDFTIHNLPYGIFSSEERSPRAGVAIGNSVLDLEATAERGYFDPLNIDTTVFGRPYLNDFIALGKASWKRFRTELIHLLSNENSPLKSDVETLLIPMSQIRMHVPVRVGDYSDFYSSEAHASNVGKMFRDPKNALLPNWKHMPVAYHGRASSIVVSGTDIHRPKGQLKPTDAPPIYGPSKAVDFELEVAFIIGNETELGESISTAVAEDHIFGFVLFNDWSARDIQKWEYVPLGPFLAKSFASSISPWIVTLDALDPFRVKGPMQDPPVLAYLDYEGEKHFDIDLEVAIATADGIETTISRSNFKYMYWNICQQLAHHTVNGCNIKIGDMMASGTISGDEPGSFGSLLELSVGGENPIKLNDDSERTFLKDNDTVIMRGFAEKSGIRIGFGEVRSTLLPAK